MHAVILGSGSKGNSTLIIGKEKKILIDVGFSYPKMTKLLDEFHLLPQDIDAILVTHAHKDHTIGLKAFLKKNMIPIYTNNMMYEEIKDLIPEELVHIYDGDFSFGEFNIEVIHTSHDAKGSVGFIVNDDDKSLVYVTDTGYINQTYIKRLKNKDIYIFESNHDINMLMTGPYPFMLKQRVVSDKGHLSNEQSGNYLKELIGENTKKIILAHLSETNNTPEIALETVKKIINTNVSIDTAYQDIPVDVGEI